MKYFLMYFGCIVIGATCGHFINSTFASVLVTIGACIVWDFILVVLLGGDK